MPVILTKREKAISYILAGIVVLAAISSFLVTPFLDKNGILDRQIRRERMRFVKYSRLLERKDEIRNRFEKSFPYSGSQAEDDDTVVAALSELERLTKDAGIHIVEMRPENREMVTLRLESGMEGYFKFLHNLEGSASLMSVKRVLLIARPNSQILEGNFYISCGGST